MDWNWDTEKTLHTAGKLFSKQYGSCATKIGWFPGRLEIVGKHTDYAGGRSVVCAIDKGLAFAFAQRHDRIIHIVTKPFSTEQTLEAVVNLDRVEEEIKTLKFQGGWTLYVAAVLEGLLKCERMPEKGVNIIVATSLPPDSGLSSSSAFICGLCCAVLDSNDILSVQDYANIERGEAIGTKGGCQDHAALMKGETDTLQVFSYHDEVAVLETAIHDFSKHNLKFVVAVSGVSACKTSNAKDRYNALAAQKHLAKHESDVVVPEFVNAFKNYTNKDMIKAAVIKSQAHAENILKITVPETEWLPKKAVSLGALCATAFGAGFGGSVWALVPSETVDIGTFINGWKTSYVKKFHHPSCFVFPTKPSHGAYIKAVKE